MWSKIFYTIFIPFLYFLAACHDELDHKNNNTQLKSAVISNSLMDPSKTIVENISRDTSFSILARSLKVAGLFEVLNKPGPFTVFAPTNSAFDKLPDGGLESLLNEREKDLSNILSHHLVAGLLEKKDIEKSQKITTLAGEDLIVTKRKDAIMINGIKINSKVIKNNNGIIYIINDLLFPRNQNPGAY
jgi:uncharacterized surface protein with fasciclin (FAS1) repeats